MAALPYAEIVFSRWQPFCAGGHGGPPLRRGFSTKAPIGAGAEDLDLKASHKSDQQSRHKKTTHALHRRSAFTSTVSTADVIRLPNWAGFCIQGGIVKRRCYRQ